ncbi:eukaryotic translation initiation factor 4G-like [Chenopodium quinoa]|uniref:eukaryotic translation initiation factor 4G-like n=1 Tax=Chenopodium quinoa TaxID=63459 RepID=UPI000B78EA9D|nr:eukaryotic translation initiation factor 4G-like [Chenopodium quinoa]
MSQNQIRVEKKEKQYRKTGGGGRLNNTLSDQNHRNYSATGTGRGASSAPPISSNNRSFKKSNNGQGGQSRGTFVSVSTPSSGSNSTAVGVHRGENGNYVQSTLHGISSPPAADSVPKPSDTSSQNSSRPIPKAPSSQSSSMTSDSTLPSTPLKGGGKEFSLQFGSISPGVMNGMQVPARTSSAPPNMDEQERNQVRHAAAARTAPPIPVSYAPKQQVPEKHVSSEEKPIAQETNTASKVTRVEVTPVPSPIQLMQPQKPAVRPMAGISMPLPYQQHQPPAGMQFVIPNPQIQTRGTLNNSHPMPMQMPFHIGNPPQQQVFVPGLQHNLMQNQGIISQGQIIGFNPQLGPQPPHQPGSLGMPLSPPFNLHQPGNVGSTRKVVRITHPETHKELTLDNRDGGSPRSRSHHVRLSPSQPMPSYTAMRPGRYYSNSYSPGPPVFPAPNCLPLPSTQAISQGPRFNYLIPSVQSTSPVVNVKASVNSGAEKGTCSSDIEKVESQKLVRLPVQPDTVKKDMEANADESSLQLKSDSVWLKKSVAYSPTNTDVIKKETVIKLDSIRDVQKHPEKKENVHSSPQDHVDSLKIAAPDVKSNISIMHVNDVSTLKESLLSTDSGSTGDSSVDLEIEDHAGKDQYNKQNGHLLQVIEQQGEKEVKGLQPGRALKSTEFVKKTEHCDETKKYDQETAGFEASQKESKSGTSGTESAETSLQMFSPKSVSKLTSDNEVSPAAANFSEAKLRQEIEITEKASPISSSGKTKNKGKKKWKEMLQKADSLGTNADLYMAYKGAEEKKETVASAEDISSTLKIPSNGENSARKNKGEKGKLELEDWEDAADVSASKLDASVKGEHRGSRHDEERAFVKKYSRDFLLTLSQQCTDLPKHCQITPEIADILSCFSANASHSDRDHATSGRNIDRPSGSARNNRHVNGMMDAGRWNKPVPQFSGQDPGLDLAYGGYMMGYQSGSGLNYGVLRNPGGHGPIQHGGGILSGPMHSMSFQGAQRYNPDAERWQRATSFDRGMMLAPQNPSQVMHRADNKYEVGKVSDEEQAKQRRLKAILNKLTPQNFEKLFEQVKEVNIDNAVTLTGVISQIFYKALTEPTFCEMYANFCSHLALELPDLSVDDEKITFKRLLLNKCQEEFERGEREEEEANKDDGEGEIKQTEAEREGKRLKARRRMLGNIRLIGELYKKRMLTERIMHECIKKLLGQYQNADEENIEALCKLMSTIGEMIDHSRAKDHMDAYFDIMWQLSNNMNLSSRVRFMLKDAIDLRKNKWQQRRKVEGPKKIEEVHRDAAQERLAQAGRPSRGPSMNPSMRRGHPVEYSQRGSLLPSPVGQAYGFRSYSTQVRGYDGHDVRKDERSTFESRTLSVTLPQCSSGDEPITLGPQGGLARGMSCRGQPSTSIASSTDTTFHGDFRRVVSGLNGYSNASDRGAYSSREDHFSRQASESFGATVSYDHSGGLERNSTYTNRDVKNPDRSMEKPILTSSLVTRAVAAPAENITSEKVWPEERLRDMSMATIKEYYSANDEKEVALCIKDLNAPKFYPTVISLWVTDAFERKALERDMLAKLLISLSKPRDSMFSPQQLIEGFDSVLTKLEDTISDAPKAPEFLGQIFGKVILENVLSLNEVGKMIHQGGEEPGRLLEIGLAGDVLGSILEMIKSEKGESTLNEIRTSSGLHFEDFRPPDPLKSKKLNMFIMWDDETNDSFSVTL